MVIILHLFWAKFGLCNSTFFLGSTLIRAVATALSRQRTSWLKFTAWLNCTISLAWQQRIWWTTPKVKWNYLNCNFYSIDVNRLLVQRAGGRPAGLYRHSCCTHLQSWVDKLRSGLKGLEFCCCPEGQDHHAAHEVHRPAAGGAARPADHFSPAQVSGLRVGHSHWEQEQVWLKD